MFVFAPPCSDAFVGIVISLSATTNIFGQTNCIDVFRQNEIHAEVKQSEIIEGRIAIEGRMNRHFSHISILVRLRLKRLVQVPLAATNGQFGRIKIAGEIKSAF